ncbi:RNA polymerase subunit sigma-24 [Pseudoxanthomonas jiangsuensis]|uniref:ECF-type sigma factor n=1 Tax=Pseudoxanthomonas jiangsuensis TaxID=619688 RepID=UPI0013911CA0|nr:ECF-type sigma factor [Pseudoxanthomonas jiangsuensis]KAF1698379.1 RNA polymerase subunit sigma-24 [Pseudoxanthomonas jiangsuensis]
MDLSDDITRLLHSWRAGDLQARESLFDAVYAMLRDMAASRLGSPRDDLTLRPTSLVHEALLRMLGRDVGFADRAHFFALVALKMRAVLVDYARSHVAAKRGGGAVNVTLSHVDAGGVHREDIGDYDVLALHQALERLSGYDERAGRAVELAYFGGMSHEEIATVLEVSVPTVDRDLRFAKAWLNRQLT